MSLQRRMLIITDGHNDLHTAKTAICLVRYRPQEVVAVLDRQSAVLSSFCLRSGFRQPICRSVGRLPAPYTQEGLPDVAQSL
jgi:hypothetical protein